MKHIPVSRKLASVRLVSLLVSAAVVTNVYPASAADEKTPSGLPRTQAIYVPMRDGVKIAVDAWLPPDFAAGAHVPAIMKVTPNWRAIGMVKQTGAMKLLSMTGAVPTEDFNTDEATAFGKGGYAMVYVDARGTGASYGVKTAPFSPDELADYGEVIDWITKQTWSNGSVAGFGEQYDGTAAELITGVKQSALKGVVSLFSDFDPWGDNIAPGGVVNDWFLKFWEKGSLMLDKNDLVAVAEYRHRDYNMLKRVIYGIKHVDADENGDMVTAAVNGHAANVDLYKVGSSLEYRDTPLGATVKTIDALAPLGMKELIAAAKTPMFVWASWLDAGTARGALTRFVEIETPQIVVIGPWSHGAKSDANPFAAVDAPVRPTKEERYAQYLKFLDGCVKGSAGPSREVRYFTMGENKWKSTSEWPPKGASMQRWYFAADKSLDKAAPTAADGADSYTVNFDATTGTANRWRTQADGEDVVYADRATEDAKLLTYTSAPLDNAVEITGSPVLTLFVSSTTTDGAFYGYVEAVAPDGKVLYLTEGMLRAIHRKVSTEKPSHAVFGPYHTFTKADAEPLEAGKVAEITFDLFPTSVLIPKGYKLRVAIAGHDASGFVRYPAQGTPTISVARNAQQASCVDLPVAAH